MAANESSKPMRAKQPAIVSRPPQRRMLRASGVRRRELKMEWRDAERECGGVEDALVRRQRVAPCERRTRPKARVKSASREASIAANARRRKRAVKREL